LRDLGRLEEAAASFEKALVLGADPELHRFYLDSVRGTDQVSPPPRLYVEGLFDSYAADFQTHLVDHLQYQGHRTLTERLLNSGRRYRSVLDLGCGTGLCGTLVHSIADTIDGVDVSGAMLEQARKHGVYRELFHEDLSTYLATTDRRADLVLAADVFVYVGDLAAAFEGIRRILEPDGLFAFTVELSSDGRDVVLLPSLRHAHSESYIRNLARRFGFARVDMLEAPIRYEQTTPIRGLYAYLS
jgi:predicted TPR repeat methyltransferase